MHTLKYIISILLFFIFTDGFSQEQQSSEVKKDTIIYKTGYGFRVGIDISKPIKRIFDKSYKGLELVADYRISKNWYIATEIGIEEQTNAEDYTNSTAKGKYIRIGTNYNVYNNWLDMNNEIFLGLRYGFSAFNQTLNSYTPNVNNTYFPAKTITTPQMATGLTAHWTEFSLGMKAEILKNIFIGMHVSYKIMLYVKDPPNFKSLFVPGFNRVFVNNTGFGFNYTISYLIPFVKK